MLTASAALASCFFCVLGSAIAAGSASSNNYKLLIVGRIVMGLGSIVLEGAQSKLYAHWFNGNWLATVIALDLAWGSATTVIARVTAVPMSHLGGWYGWALWIPVFVIAACTGLVIAYTVFEQRYLPAEFRPPTGYELEQKRRAAGERARGGMLRHLQRSILSVLRL